MEEKSFIIPQDFESVGEYAKVRTSLINTEKSIGCEGRTPLADIESQAQQIVQNLKIWEKKNLHCVYPDGCGWEAGHHFLHGLDAIDKSRVYKIVQAAPKGALLHCHFDNILPPQTLLESARTQENLYIKTDCPLTSKCFFDGALPQFRLLPEVVAVSATNNIFAKTYVAGSWMKYSEFLVLFPGGPTRAEAWLSKQMVIGPEDAYHPNQTVDGIWRQFQRSVNIMRSLLSYESAYRQHFRNILWKFAQDGVSYAEIRFAMTRAFAIQSDDGKHEYRHHEVARMLSEILAQETPKIRDAGYDFHGVKVIYAGLRFASRDDMKWSIDNCIELKQEFPDLICAFDLQGQEDSGQTLLYWIEELLDMRSRIKQLNLDLPFVLHAGETLDHGGDTDSNLVDAILLGAKRIGHGFSLPKHPLLMELCKEKKIVIEACPVSNEVLGLCPTIKLHHLPVLMSNCVPCTINSDDPGSWGSSVMSHDFYQALVGTESTTLIGLRTTAEWSIEYSNMSTEIREQAGQSFREKWIKFCQWVVDTYGDKV